MIPSISYVFESLFMLNNDPYENILFLATNRD